LRRDLVPIPETAEHRWRVYVVQTGKMYHAIIVQASSLGMKLNGGFYDELVRSFHGIRE
jgi:hypothetical protein